MADLLFLRVLPVSAGRLWSAFDGRRRPRRPTDGPGTVSLEGALIARQIIVNVLVIRLVVP
ncbi:hypothetical protein AB0C02_22085 [Micromonospora sp. NPDC048999]|uniref:hypothetical protein n=1 Tax=Micromonospora sp. NPDC048999 TaxID=3155391 RepID=UPI0033D972EF